MTRESATQRKRGVSITASAPSSDGTLLPRESALHLLARSIRFGHPRLAVLRLIVAVQAGAHPSHDQWRYCSDAALNSKDITLQALFEQASARASAARQSPSSTIHPLP
jgi:hypothetical protein